MFIEDNHSFQFYTQLTLLFIKQKLCISNFTVSCCFVCSLFQWTVGEWPVAQDHKMSSLSYGVKISNKHKKHRSEFSGASSNSSSVPSSSSQPPPEDASATGTGTERPSKKRLKSHDIQDTEEGNVSSSNSPSKISSKLGHSPTMLQRTPELKLKKIPTTPPTSSPLRHPLEEFNEVKTLRSLRDGSLQGDSGSSGPRITSPQEDSLQTKFGVRSQQGEGKARNDGDYRARMNSNYSNSQQTLGRSIHEEDLWSDLDAESSEANPSQGRDDRHRHPSHSEVPAGPHNTRDHTESLANTHVPNHSHDKLDQAQASSSTSKGQPSPSSAFAASSVSKEICL